MQRTHEVVFVEKPCCGNTPDTAIVSIENRKMKYKYVQQQEINEMQMC